MLNDLFVMPGGIVGS